MILFSVLAAVGACVVLTLLDAFYDSIIKWLSKIGEVAQRVVKGGLLLVGTNGIRITPFLKMD